MINRTTITIHTRERTVVRPLSDASLVQCRECQSEVVAVTAECAAQMLQVSSLAIRELINGGLLHATPIRFGACLICGQSLLNFSAHENERGLGGDS